MWYEELTQELRNEAFVLNVETGELCISSICEEIDCDTMKALCEEVTCRLKDNMAVTFSKEFMGRTVCFRCQRIAMNNEFILVAIEDIEENYIKFFDMHFLAHLVTGGLLIIKESHGKYTATSANNGLLSMLGYTREECLELFNHDVLSFIYPDDIEPGLQMLGEQMKQSNRFNLTGRLICKSKKLLWVSFSGVRIGLSESEYLFVAMIADITKEKTLINESFMSKQIFELLKGVTKNVVFVYDMTKKICSFSGAIITKYTGDSTVTYTKEEFLNGKPFLTISQSYVEKIAKAISENRLIDVTISAQNENDVNYFFSTRYDFIYDSEGKASMIVGEAIDVTDQIAAQKYYEQFLNDIIIGSSSKESVLSVDLSNNSVVGFYGEIFENSIEESRRVKGEAREILREVFDKITDQDFKKKVKYALAFKRLITNYHDNKTSFEYEFKLKKHGATQWYKLHVSLFESHIEKSIIGVFKFVNISNEKLKKKINEVLFDDSFDFICCIYARENSCVTLDNFENNGLLPDISKGNYEEITKEMIKKYSVPEDKSYLKFCLSLKNIKNQLKSTKVYTFVGHGVYPDNSPAVKLHRFMYVDKENQIILYTRKDITSMTEELVITDEECTRRISFSDILYVESFGKKSCINTRDSKIVVNEMISSIQKRMPGKQFTRCHRCYLLNFSAIESVNKDRTITVKNNDVISVSRNNVSRLREWLYKPQV